MGILSVRGVDKEVQKALRVRAAETGETMGAIVERALRRELGMEALRPELTWEVIEDNGGGLHLAVFEGDGVIYYASGYERMPGALQQDLEALRAGSHPVRDGWYIQDWIRDGEHDIQSLYDDLCIGETNGGAVVADQDGIYYDRMGSAAERAFMVLWQDLDDVRTTYSNGGTEHEAIQIPWDTVRAILGHDHTGDPDEDRRLVDALLAAGAPEWVRDAEGWVDEHGWGLIGPAIDEAADNG